MKTNVPASGPDEDLPRVAWRIGRAFQHPHAFEAVVGWDRNPSPDLGERTYRRQIGLAVILPRIVGRFRLRVIS